MASGDPVIEVIQALPPATAYATPDTRAGGSTPAEAVQVWDFAADATEYMDFLCRLSEKYAGGGLTLTLAYSMSSATTGGVVWNAAIRRLADDAEDIDGAHSYDFNSFGTDTVPSASGEVGYPTCTFTNGADMDSWAAGELAIIRIKRVHDDAGDDAAGDAELWGLSGKET